MDDHDDTGPGPNTLSEFLRLDRIRQYVDKWTWSWSDSFTPKFNCYLIVIYYFYWKSKVVGGTYILFEKERVLINIYKLTNILGV